MLAGALDACGTCLQVWGETGSADTRLTGEGLQVYFGVEDGFWKELRPGLGTASQASSHLSGGR